MFFWGGGGHFPHIFISTTHQKHLDTQKLTLRHVRVGTQGGMEQFTRGSKIITETKREKTATWGLKMWVEIDLKMPLLFIWGFFCFYILVWCQQYQSTSPFNSHIGPPLWRFSQGTPVMLCPFKNKLRPNLCVCLPVCVFSRRPPVKSTQGSAGSDRLRLFWPSVKPKVTPTAGRTDRNAHMIHQTWWRPLSGDYPLTARRFVLGPQFRTGGGG